MKRCVQALAVSILLITACGSDGSSQSEREPFERVGIYAIYQVVYDDLGDCTEYELDDFTFLTVCKEANVVLR